MQSQAGEPFLISETILGLFQQVVLNMSLL